MSDSGAVPVFGIQLPPQARTTPSASSASAAVRRYRGRRSLTAAATCVTVVNFDIGDSLLADTIATGAIAVATALLACRHGSEAPLDRLFEGPRQTACLAKALARAGRAVDSEMNNAVLAFGASIPYLELNLDRSSETIRIVRPGDHGWRIVILDARRRVREAGALASPRELLEAAGRAGSAKLAHSEGRARPGTRSRCP